MKDPFDIDLSAATYQEDEEEIVTETRRDDLFDVPTLTDEDNG